MLLIVLIIGASMFNVALLDEKVARNQRDRLIALHAAELALADAELDIENSAATGSRSAIFSAQSATGFIENCAKGDDNPFQGLCIRSGPSDVWIKADLADSGANSASVRYGRFTGKTMPGATGPLASQPPRYIIELMMDNTPGQTTDARYLYRITSIGFGTDERSQVVLQSFYRKAAK